MTVLCAPLSRAILSCCTGSQCSIYSSAEARFFHLPARFRLISLQPEFARTVAADLRQTCPVKLFVSNPRISSTRRRCWFNILMPIFTLRTGFFSDLELHINLSALWAFFSSHVASDLGGGGSWDTYVRNGISSHGGIMKAKPRARDLVAWLKFVRNPPVSS